MRIVGPHPAFLPLAVSAARSADERAHDSEATDVIFGSPAAPATTARRHQVASMLRQRAEAANMAAAECWTALLAGCDAPARRVLTFRLRELTEATARYVGARCWFSATAPHRSRVVSAETRIAEAIREGDGAEFAEALVGYDQAVATAVASAPHRAESRTP